MANENTIQILETDIQNAKNCLDNGTDKEIYDLFCLLNAKYGKKYDVTVTTWIVWTCNSKVDYKEYKRHMLKLVNKLELLLANLKDEKEKTDNKASINITNNNSSNSNSIINQNFDFTTTIKNIQKIPNEILDEKLKTELLGILTEIEHADEKESKKEKFMKAIKWLGDKSVDVVIQILPYLAGVKF